MASNEPSSQSVAPLPIDALYPEVAEQLQLWCQQYPLQTLVIGYSGGLDSSVMLHLAWRFVQANAHLRLIPVHIHHGLQASADDWAVHCQAVAAGLGLICQVEHVRLIAKPRTSLEAQARDARYHALAAYMGAGCALLTGHHIDDQAETLLLALKRGSGVKGLSAMGATKPYADGQLLRPLLNCTRQQLQRYAEQHGLSWIEDGSNQDLAFDRNFLRHQVLPILNQRWPGMTQAVARSASHCAESQALLEQLAEIDLDGWDVAANQLPLSLFNVLSESRRNNLLRYWLSQHRVSMPGAAILQQIWQSVAQSRADALACVRWQGWQIRRYAAALHLLSDETEQLQQQTVQINTLSQQAVLADGRTVQFEQLISGERLKLPQGLAVSLRFDVTGLRFHPHNRNHSRPLKKLWQEWQVPPWQRKQVPLLFFGEQLVAVIGYGLAREWLAEGQQPGLLPRVVS